MLVPHSFKSCLVPSLLAVTIVLLQGAPAAFAQVHNAQQVTDRRFLSPIGQNTAPPASRDPVQRLTIKANAANSIAPAFSLQVYDTGGAEAVAAAAGDLNGDGWPDLAVANLCTISFMSCASGGSVAIFMNNGGSFSGPAVYSSGGTYTDAVGFADVNHDGKLDLLVASSCSGGDPYCITTGVLFSNGDGSLQPVQPYSGTLSNPSWTDFPDFNGDGVADQVWASGPDSASGTVYVQLSNPDGTYQPPFAYSSGGEYAISTVVVDVNGDGYPDILALNQCPNAGLCSSAGATGYVGVLVNNGDGTFQSTVSFSTGGVGSNSITVADVNRDGKPDILVTNQCNDQGICPHGDGTLGVLINAAFYTATKTTLTSSRNPATVGQSVTFTATVTPYGETLPEGESVTFKNGNTALGTAPLIDGVASLATKTLPVGTLNITASYPFDGIYGASHAELSQVVKAVKTYSTTLAFTATPNPAYAQPITFTAKVTSAYAPIPDGELVTFFSKGVALGTAATTSGVASLTLSSLALGTYRVQAVYPGDSNFKASTATLTAQVMGRQTGIYLYSSSNPTSYGQAVTFSAIVYPLNPTYDPAEDTPTGKVRFTWSRFSLGSAPLIAFAPGAPLATFTVSTLNADAYPIVAEYLGDSNFAPSNSAVVNQTVLQATSSSTLISSMNPSTLGQPVTFTATVTSPTVTAKGPVTFTAGNTTLGTVQLSRGIAKLTTSSLPQGISSVVVTYLGDSNIEKTTASVVQVVQ